MSRLTSIFLILFSFLCYGYSQLDEIWAEPEPMGFDTTRAISFPTPEEVNEFINKQALQPGEFLIGGYVNSIFRESIDSVEIIISIDGQVNGSVYSHEGLFLFTLTKKGSVIDISFSHADYHPQDTSFIHPGTNITTLFLSMQPKYKILLRGRVYAGNMPLEGVHVTVRHNDEVYNLTTLGCFYDKEKYWNCLFDGMFKLDITTMNPADSVHIYLMKNGMKPLHVGMTINEYTGEIMYIRMKYESKLPEIPYNNLSLKLGFPVLSLYEDWFVSLSYYRLLNTSYLKRFAYGIETNLYITSVSVTHNTFNGLEPSRFDSSYIDAFLGPSFLFWLVAPEKRNFSTYGGCTFAYNFKKPEWVIQPFIGSRIFLDMNKSISLEIRYCEFKADVVHYTFNPYGNASRYEVESVFTKLHANLGIQIVF